MINILKLFRRKKRPVTVDDLIVADTLGDILNDYIDNHFHDTDGLVLIWLQKGGDTRCSYGGIHPLGAVGLCEEAKLLILNEQTGGDYE